MKLKGYVLIFCIQGILLNNLWTADWERGVLLKVTQTTEVFKTASAKSKSIADVDEGTTLLLRRSSPRALWLEVEDEDGNVGWIAASKTDYSSIKARQVPLAQQEENKKLRPLKFEEKNEPLPQQKRNYSHELSGVYRASWVDPSGHRAWGAHYTLFFLEDLWHEGKTMARAGISTGFMDYSEDKSFLIPFRLRYQTQATDSVFYFGPEMGLLWMRVKGRDNHFNFSFAYTIGALFARHATIFIRPAADLFYATRFSFEVGLGLRL